MKIHITNSYGGYLTGNRVLQQRIAEAGKGIGMYEMGIYQYPVHTDTPRQLDKRLDGVTSALESEDVVFVQLPTGNGALFEQQLLAKCWANKAKTIILIHDHIEEIEPKWLNYAERIMVASEVIRNELIQRGINGANIEVLSFRSQYALETIKYNLLKYAHPYYEKTETPDWQDCADDVVHICMGLHDGTGHYSKYVGGVMQSIFEHTEAKIHMHLFVDDTVSTISRQRLAELAQKYGNIVFYHYVDPERFDANNPFIRKFSVGTMFRLMIPKVLSSLPKVIYLDADLIVMRDIIELWNVSMDSYALAAVIDTGVAEFGAMPIPVSRGMIPGNKYFNAGVLVMNLDRIRSKGNLDVMVTDFIRQYPEMGLPDQDALNCLFYKETLLLDESWNTFVYYARQKGTPWEKRIYHYASLNTCVFDYLKEWDRAYYRYMLDGSWDKSKEIDDLMRGFNCAYVHVDSLQKLVHSLREKEKRIVFIGSNSKSMANTRSMLDVKENDLFIENVDESSLDNLKAVVTEDKEKTLVVVLPDALNGKIVQTLDGWNLIREKDYFITPMLMKSSQGGYLL